MEIELNIIGFDRLTLIVFYNKMNGLSIVFLKKDIYNLRKNKVKEDFL